MSIDEVVARTNERLDAQTLEKIELGVADIDQAELDLLIRVYAVDIESILPGRGKLVLDLSDGFVASGGRQESFGAGEATIDDVLDAYLRLIYGLRRAPSGSPLPMRHNDLAVLAEALWVEQGELETRLVRLMRLSGKSKRVRRKALDEAPTPGNR